MATTPIMSLQLFLDKEKKKVEYAICGNDFVDVLLSFLTMPIGTIIRLTGKELGGMSTLYESVKNESVNNPDVSFLQPEACKKMLLYPKNASEEHCKKLKVNIDTDTEPTKYNAQCGCGQSMAECVASSQHRFVKGNMRFKIKDDLQVFRFVPTEATSTSPGLEKLTVNVGAEEATSLLKASLISKSVLTDVLYPKDTVQAPSSKVQAVHHIRRP